MFKILKRKANDFRRSYTGRTNAMRPGSPTKNEWEFTRIQVDMQNVIVRKCTCMSIYKKDMILHNYSDAKHKYSSVSKTQRGSRLFNWLSIKTMLNVRLASEPLQIIKESDVGKRADKDKFISSGYCHVMKRLTNEHDRD